MNDFDEGSISDTDRVNAQFVREFAANFDRDVRKADRQFWRMFGGIFFGVGSIFALVGIGMGIHTQSYLSKAAAADGTIIDNNLYRSTDADERPTSFYYPVVKFTPKSSDKLTIFVGSSGSNPPFYRKGQQVKVLYNPEYPDSAQIESWFELWLFPAIFAGIGVPLTAIGAGALVKSFKK